MPAADRLPSEGYGLFLGTPAGWTTAVWRISATRRFGRFLPGFFALSGPNGRATRAGPNHFGSPQNGLSWHWPLRSYKQNFFPSPLRREILHSAACKTSCGVHKGVICYGSRIIKVTLKEIAHVLIRYYVGKSTFDLFICIIYRFARRKGFSVRELWHAALISA